MLMDLIYRSRSSIDMKTRQKSLMETYGVEPEKAVIVDSASTSSQAIPASDAIHTSVAFGHAHPAIQQMGVHRAVGGDCDFPNPGEMFSAAIASCLDTTIRIIANRFALAIKRLSVTVDSSVDVRGTLRVARDVPVGFSRIDIKVDLVPAVPIGKDKIAMLIKAAESSCVVLQTLHCTPSISLSQRRA